MAASRRKVVAEQATRRTLAVEKFEIQAFRLVRPQQSRSAALAGAPPTPTVPAVVVGGTLNALGVVRSLSPGRMKIYLLETSRQCAAGWSRHCSYIPTSEPDGSILVDSLAGLAARLGCRPVLILTSDQSVNCVSERRAEIEALYRISMPPHAVVRALADKTLFQALAQREGLAVPRGVCVADARDIERLDTLQPPLVVKPADKTLALKGIVERAVRAETVTVARRVTARMLARAPRIIVQEWVDGPDTEIFFTLFSCDRDGKPLGMFPGRKLVCEPPAIGTTAVCVAAPEVADELVALTLEFIARVGYRGLGSLEFKREARTGRFLIIEPTVGRTDWQEEIAALCGVNLPLMTYFGELGENCPAVAGTSRPIAWRSSAGYRAPRLSGTRTFDGFFRWSDPLPAVYYYGYERVLVRLRRKIWALPVRMFAGDAKE